MKWAWKVAAAWVLIWVAVGLAVAAVAAVVVGLLSDEEPGPRYGAGLPALEPLAAEALAAWGVAGMEIDIAYAPAAEMDGHVGLSWPGEGFRSGRIRIHEGVDPRDLRGIVCHEVGHLVGHWSHSAEAGSCMANGAYESTSPTARDLATARANRVPLLPSAVTVPAVSR